MRRWSSSPICTVVLVAALVLPSVGGGALAADDEWTRIEALVNSYRMGEARKAIKKQKKGNGPRELYVRGKFLFYAGRYGAAEEMLRRAIEMRRTELDWKYLRDQVRVSMKANEKLVRTDGGKGGFVFYHEDSSDAVLVPYATRTLVAQRRALKKSLGDGVESMRVYIVPTVEMLSDLCGLSVEQIEATGTVALSRYNRIMLLSPRAVHGGYPWLDTLAHELTHISIARISRDRAPIWLHEGLAKYFETAWRGGSAGRLTPESAYLLDRAAGEGRLIPLRKFHPSVSFLPNQEDAALAYAQGLSFLTYLRNHLSEDQTLRDLLLRMGQGESADGAIKQSTGTETRKLYRWWQEELRGTRQAPAEMVPLMQLKFRVGEATEKGSPDALFSAEVRRHLRVGDLLRLRGHVKAAAKEYQWAMKKNETLVPEVFDRLVGVLLELGQGERALEILDEARTLYPTHAAIYLYSGLAHIKSGNTRKARRDLKRVISLNPFHPDVHCLLADLYKEQHPRQAKLERDHCLLLGHTGGSGK